MVFANGTLPGDVRLPESFSLQEKGVEEEYQ